MITCCIQHTLDRYELAAFEDYAERWPPIIERCRRRTRVAMHRQRAAIVSAKNSRSSFVTSSGSRSVR
jgi:hypothetical protein